MQHSNRLVTDHDDDGNASI